jgi:uncharacterized protein YjbJ (UPF0337 family)
MNKDRVNGTIDEVLGSAKQKVGKIIGNPSLQVKGLAQQAKGKIENAIGKIEDTAAEPSVHPNPPGDTRP